MNGAPMDLSAIDPVWWVIIGVVVLLIVFALIAMASRRRAQRSQRLRKSFRSEYDRAKGAGSRKEAEADLERRLARRRDVDLTDLDEASAEDFAAHIEVLEREFVDGPQGAANGMTQLVGRIAVARGYVATEEGVLDLVSVDHPEPVASLRRGLADVERTKGAELTEVNRRVFLDARVLAERLLAEGRTGRFSEADDRLESRDDHDTNGALEASDARGDDRISGSRPEDERTDTDQGIPAAGERATFRPAPPDSGA
ncbi:MAG: hypothetical protein WD670_03390, partial [Actinomycetota bacterium]